MWHDVSYTIIVLNGGSGFLNTIIGVCVLIGSMQSLVTMKTRECRWIGTTISYHTSEEMDRVLMGDVDSREWTKVFSAITIEIRLLVPQILGKRSTNTAYKSKAAYRQIALESYSESDTRNRIASCCTDAGVERGLWTMPRLDGKAGRAFPNMLPLSDLDHGLHHTMLELECSYDSELYDVFEMRIRALAKFFCHRDSCDRFVKIYIIENVTISSSYKQTLSRMFKSTCPTWVKIRWHFQHEVLAWVRDRKALLCILRPGAITADNENGITATEADSLASLFTDDFEAKTFWAMLDVTNLSLKL